MVPARMIKKLFVSGLSVDVRQDAWTLTGVSVLFAKSSPNDRSFTICRVELTLQVLQGQARTMRIPPMMGMRAACQGI